MKQKPARRRVGNSEIHLGFQIAPMIDVVFVILLFFMVAAGQAQKETALNTELPGIIDGSPIDLPDEIAINIDLTGQVYLNDEALDQPDMKPLSELTQSIRTLKQAAGDVSKISILLTADEQVRYQRIVDVLDVLARENISAVTFQSE